MNSGYSFERCLSFINCNLAPSAQPLPYDRKALRRMTVTISRQTGSGAMVIAQKLADYLQAQIPGRCRWTVFDRNLMEKVLEEHHLPKDMGRFLPEDHISMIEDMMDELLGLHPPSWTVVHQTTETILRLAQMGNVILIGRGGNVVTATNPNAFHVRLVAPLEKRVARIQEQEHLSRPKALQLIRQSERGRARYLKKYFQAEVDDPLLYDMVINTARFDPQEVASLIGQAVVNRARADREEVLDR